jgi:hypothetical protein
MMSNDEAASMNCTHKQIADGKRGIGVAYHEVGRAVIGRVLGLGLSRARFWPYTTMKAIHLPRGRGGTKVYLWER